MDKIAATRDEIVDILTEWADLWRNEGQQTEAGVADAVAAVVTSQAEEIERLRDLVEQFLRCEYESAGKYGLIDCFDNTGKPYQSAHLASVIERAEAAL